MLHVRIFTASVSFVDISNFRVEGMHVSVSPGWQYQPCDVAIMYGLANPPRRSPQGLLRNAIYREHKGPIVVIESCLIGRSFKPRLPGWLAAFRRRPLRPRQIHPYYRVAIGGALGDDADFCAQNSPPDRWEHLQAEMGIRLKPYRVEGRHILLIGQTPKDASLRGIDMKKWLPETAVAIRQLSSRPIMVRMHPSMRWKDRERTIAALSAIPGVAIAPAGRPFSQDAAGAWTCVTLSSGAAIDALIEGVPPICLSPASLAYGICSTSLAALEHPMEPEREQFMRDLSYSQWTLAEFADGTVWRHLVPGLERELARTGHKADLQLEPSRSSQQGAPALQRIPHVDTERRRLEKSLALWKAVAKILPVRTRKSLIGQAAAQFKLGRFAEAERLYAEVCELRPKDRTAHEGLACAAEKLGRWEIAAQAWVVANRLAPDRKSPLVGQAGAWLKLGKLLDAERAYRMLRERFPAEKAGFYGLERVADRRGDWALALQMQETIWTKFGDPDSLRRQVLLLVRLQQMDKARDIVDALEAGTQTVAYLLAAMPLLEATHDWATMESLLAANEATILENWQLLRSWVSVMGRLGRADQALDLLQRGSAGGSVARSKLRIATLIRARRYGEAGENLRHIWEQGEIDDFSPELLSPMMSAAWEAGGVKLACRVLDRVEQEAPATAAGPALRLSAIFQRARLTSLEGGLSLSARAAPTPSVEDQLRLLPALRFGGDTARQQRETLTDVCSIFSRLRASHPAFFPDPSFVLSDALEVAVRMTQAFDRREPLSLMRLGDGEGSLLPYREGLEMFRRADGDVTTRTWWGEGPRMDVSLQHRLQEAIRSADILGFPDLERACRGMLDTSLESIGDSGRNARGLLASIDYVAGNAHGHSALTSCHVHQSLAFWGLWDLLLPRFGTLSLITCHVTLESVLARRHGIRVDAVHLIPPEHKYALAFDDTLDGRHYPDVFETLREQLNKPSSGRVFLVSAGVLGKIYCMWIRQAGGIAIDIGSAADFWCGYDTRSVADVATYRTADGVADRVRGLVEKHPRFCELLAPVMSVGRAAGGSA